MNDHLTTGLIIKKARQWLATPYTHQASLKHQGCDCLGLVRGIWREVIGSEPEETPVYSSDWGEVGNRELLREVVEKHFIKSNQPNPAPADLLLFRWRKTSIIKHLGIMISNTHFIHAYEKSGVVESPLVRDWQRRIAGIYKFPGIKN